METHVRVLGILHIVFGVLGILGALFLVLVFGGAAAIVGVSGADEARTAVPIVGVLGVVGGLLACIVFVVSLPGLIAGIGVLKHREWARILMLVVSVVDLLNVPLGTALGVYGLWTLLQPETIALFRRLPPGTQV